MQRHRVNEAQRLARGSNGRPVSRAGGMRQMLIAWAIAAASVSASEAKAQPRDMAAQMGGMMGAYGSASGATAPQCDTAAQMSAMTAWRCANAAAQFVSGGDIVGSVSDQIADRLGCELPTGFFQSSPSWLSSIPVLSNVLSVGDLVTQCGINLPASLAGLLIEHLGDVYIPPEMYGIGDFRQTECTTSSGRPGQFQLTSLGRICSEIPGSEPVSCPRPAPPDCTADEGEDAVFSHEFGDYCADQPDGTMVTLYITVSCTDDRGTVSYRQCSLGACGYAMMGPRPFGY